jgi:hypothetical protein
MFVVVNLQPEVVIFPPVRGDWFDIDEVPHDCQWIVVSLNELYQPKNGKKNEKNESSEKLDKVTERSSAASGLNRK